jgi:tetratricopeptide (TPR) repeat protein
VRSGDQLRATAQLVEAPGGTVLASHTIQSTLGDLFRLQDDIAQRVVEALALPLGGGTDSPTPVAPGSAHAYELYLRANGLARRYEQMREARDLYERCLELDPKFAPAWAQLGRCQRVIAKYLDVSAADGGARAEQAFRRALELDPRLSLAHKFYANLEADMGQARSALARLLDQANRHGNDAELFAGLVHACRYCGLLEQSIAAHGEARRLDPNVPTSVEQSILMTCDLQRLLAVERSRAGAGDDVIRIIGLGLAGRREEARAALVELQKVSSVAAFRTWTDHLMAWLERRAADMFAGMSALGWLQISEDPEAICQEGWLLCDVGEHASGLERLRGAVANGYPVAETLARAKAFDALRGDPVFRQVLADAEAGRERALATFREHGGERLLGR